MANRRLRFAQIRDNIAGQANLSAMSPIWTSPLTIVSLVLIVLAIIGLLFTRPRK